MPRTPLRFCLATIILFSSVSRLQAGTDSLTQDSTVGDTFTYEQMIAGYIDSVHSMLRFQTGTIPIGAGVATLVVPAGYKYLNPEQSAYVLNQLWGNPPSANLGILFPEDMFPLLENFTYAIEITYEEEGYVEDDDADEIDYTDLLETLREEADASNVERLKYDYPEIEIIGWAAEPFYDKENKKLHWAKELHFGEEPFNTLNYDVRILGRKGYLTLSAISSMEHLPLVESKMDEVIQSINFNEGYQYKDFDPELDEIAAYGIGGLITGKLLAKVGFLAVLLKFWKVIAIAAAGGIALFRKRIAALFQRKASPTETESPKSE